MNGARLHVMSRVDQDVEGESTTTHPQHDESESVQDTVTASIDVTPFPFEPNQLSNMFDPKNFDALVCIGGTDGLLYGLGTDAGHGLSTKSKPSATERPSSGDDIDKQSKVDAAFTATLEDRKRVYGDNVLPTRKPKSLLLLLWMAYKDKLMIFLMALVSLALILYQSLGVPRRDKDAPVGWVGGVIILIAMTIVVIVNTLNDWQKERQFEALNQRNEERGVKVIRDGRERVINLRDVLVGDIALMEPGEIIPCDGIFISGHNVQCDESGCTGESDAIKKRPYEQLQQLAFDRKLASSESERRIHEDCFVLSGAKVLEGVGKYVVCAVGPKSFNGRILMSLRNDIESTPLQIKLTHLAEFIGRIGCLAGVALFVALLIKFFLRLGANDLTSDGKWLLTIIMIFILALTVVTYAVPQGLLLVHTLALSFATKRMAGSNLSVRVLGAIETMANVTVVCTDKTGILTQNAMKVVAGLIGIHLRFGLDTPSVSAHRSTGEEMEEMKQSSSVEMDDLNSVLSPPLQTLINEAIALNSTAFQDVDAASGEVAFVGSKIDTALLHFARSLKWKDFQETRDTAQIVDMIPFLSERKAMGVVTKLPSGQFRLYIRGASEMLAKASTRCVVVPRDGGSHEGIDAEDIDADSREKIFQTMASYAGQALRTVALCYRDFETWPPHGLDLSETIPFDELASDLTLIATIAIQDPLRPDVHQSVDKLRQAGVEVKMCTGDNVLTARSIATQCGIFTPGGIIMEGPTFRRLSQNDKIEISPRLQVVARASPEDKKLLVETLQMTGGIVAATGRGSDVGPALKTANVGFSMGMTGTEVAREAADIILIDDNFSSIVKAMVWGRCVNDSVRKFLQYQISASITAVVITFVLAVASEEGASTFSFVKLLWINIIMDTLAALALATEPTAEKLPDRQSQEKSASLFSVEMYKMILMQSFYQISILLLLHFVGPNIANLEHTHQTAEMIRTLVCNVFVFCQIFNLVNCRRIDSRLNIFDGIQKNVVFMAVVLFEIVVQIVSIFVGASESSRLGSREWGLSLAFSFFTIPLGCIVRCIPNRPFLIFFTAIHLMESLTTDSDDDGRVRYTAEALPTATRPSRSRSWTISLFLLFTLGMPRLCSELYGASQQGSREDHFALWNEHLTTLHGVWTILLMMHAVFLPMSITFLQLPAISEGIIARSFVLTVAFSSMTGALVSLMFVLAKGKLTREEVLVRWIEAAATQEFNSGVVVRFWGPLSLPAICMAWSFIFSVLSLIAFVFNTLPHEIINIPDNGDALHGVLGGSAQIIYLTIIACIDIYSVYAAFMFAFGS